MTTDRRTRTSLFALIALLGLVALAVLMTPTPETGGAYSTHSSAPAGMRLPYDLAHRLGWRTEQRDEPFTDSVDSPADVQVIVNANLAATEAHALLEHVRRGGGLLVAGSTGALADSLPTIASYPGEPVNQRESVNCRAISVWDISVDAYTRLGTVGWRRPAPADTVGFGLLLQARGSISDSPVPRRRAAVGYSLGAGRIVIVADGDFIANDMIRRCRYEADVTFIRMLQYLSKDRESVRVAFDEYHHGYGAHGGSFTAIRMYLGETGSGRMLAQMGIAGVLLLFAAAPRPLAPRDPLRVARRSPLEHADALAHAYAGVKATRTATARLLAGVRRRTRRTSTRGRQSDEQLLAQAVAIAPGAADAAASVAHALAAPVPERELPAVANAIATIEAALTTRPTSPTR